MTISYSRARKLLLSAEHHLAVGEGDVRKRLRRVYRLLRTLEPRELPLSIRAEWIAAKREMAQYGPAKGPDGETWRDAVTHTLSRIRNSTARKIAERIYRLHAHLSHARTGDQLE